MAGAWFPCDLRRPQEEFQGARTGDWLTPVEQADWCLMTHGDVSTVSGELNPPNSDRTAEGSANS